MPSVEGRRSWDEIHQLMHANVIVFGWGSHDPIEVYHRVPQQPLCRGPAPTTPDSIKNPKVDDYLDKAISAENL